MNPVSILDASLRDGGHRTNFHFKDDDLKKYYFLLITQVLNTLKLATVMVHFTLLKI